MLIEYLNTDFEFKDERGTLTQLVHDNWKQVNYITTKAGVERGNHYHKENREAFYIIYGEFELIVEDIVTGVKETYKIKDGDFFMIEPFINHSFKYLKDTALISMYSKGVEQGGKMDMYNP